MRKRTVTRLALTLAALAVGNGAVAAPGLAQTGSRAVTLETQTVVDWNAIALRTTAAAPFDPPLESRNLALVQGAVFDAVDSIRGRHRPHAIRSVGSNDASVVSAEATAAYRTLLALYPTQAASLDQAYQASLAKVPDGTAKTHGVMVGEAAAQAMLAIRALDHSADTVPYTPGSGPGAWVPTPPAFRAALDPGWGHVTPFLLRSGSQFRPGPPPALTSPTYTRDFNEITRAGSATSTTRRPEQTNLARFWVSTAPQIWNQAAQQLSVSHGVGVWKAARLFALLNAAGADAFIASWDAKFTYNQWRPVTAIRAADTDGNRRTAADPAWTPLLLTPPFPDYPAGHTTYAGAAETILSSVLGTQPGAFTLRSATTPGVELTYTSFAAVAADVVNARVWGGIHWRTSSETGRTLGRRIADYGLAHTLAPADVCRGARTIIHRSSRRSFPCR
jgi:membrane-associated phospholipid phosphatase